MCGITQAVYDDERDARALPRRSVRESTWAERAAIYWSRYWQLAQCSAVPLGVDFALFNFARNSVVSRAVRTLQGLVGAAADGVMARYTPAAVARYCEQHRPATPSDSLCHARLAWMQSLGTCATFGHGLAPSRDGRVRRCAGR